MKPEQCHHHLGTCREPQWGNENCFKPHIIYLANSSGVKVGITRKSNAPSRWIDQGAVKALPILEVDSRIKSGQIEVALKEYVSDKTNWRKMLRNDIVDEDLVKTKKALLDKMPYLLSETNATTIDQGIVEINYPVTEYPDSVISLSFDKSPTISGLLLGIKAQYLIFDCGVLNIRKFSSYNITLNY
jgi:hypothetical protein